jgi:hypothetical protein
MFVTVDLQTVFYMRCVGMLVTCVYAIFLAPNLDDSLAIITSKSRKKRLPGHRVVTSHLSKLLCVKEVTYFSPGTLTIHHLRT